MLGGNSSFSGGGIHNYLARLTLENVGIRGNSADISGGGIYNLEGQVTLIDSIVSDNTAGEGGGISNSTDPAGSNSPELTILNSEIEGNTASTDGGGLWIWGPAMIDNSSIVSNTAGISSTATTAFGGGVMIKDSSVLSLTNSIVRGNSLVQQPGTDTYGGGIHVDHVDVWPGGRLVMVNSVVSNNQPEGISAGWGTNQLYPYPEVDIKDSLIQGNGGDGLSLLGGTHALTDTIITQNIGDGIYWESVIWGHTLTLQRAEVSENSGYGIQSIKQANLWQGDLWIYNSTIRDNADRGIFVDRLWMYNSTVNDNSGSGVFGWGRVEIQDSTIFGNHTASSGGGIYVAGFSAELYLTNSTISGNSADGNGGGIYIDASAKGELSGVTITDNTANADGNDHGDGGGIIKTSELGWMASVQNSLIAGNHDLSPALFDQLPDCAGVFNDNGYNLLSIEDGCDGEFSGATNLIGTMASPIDPLLDVLADNGSPTWTHALLPGSPAIDWVFEDLCTTFDQRGAPRPDMGGYNCDIGAYEVTTCPLPVVPVGFSITRSNSNAVLSWGDDPANREYVIFRGQNPYNPASASLFASLPNGVTMDTDYGVLTDVQSNYFYTVLGENACGERSAPPSVLGEFTFGLKPPTASGPNFALISVPLTGGSLPVDADSLASYIDDGNTVKRVAAWNPVTGSYIVRIVGCAICGSNFTINPGDSVAIAYSSSVPTAFSYVGAPPVEGSLSNPLQPNAVNLIQVPIDQIGQFPPNAAGLLTDIGGVSRVANWNRSTQAWDVYNSNGTGTNFPVYPGYPYVIFTELNVPPNWP